MTPEMKKYIDLLESQLGYSEKADAYTKFGHWYGKNVEFDADYSSAPWCDMYLSWAAHKLGYQDWIGQFAWTVGHAEWFKEQGAWGHQPKPGALVFYDWSGSNDIDAIDHVGLVTKVEGDKIFTIEGNIDGGVAKRKERDTSKVVGYGYPEKIKTRLENEATKNQVEGEWDAQHRATEQTSTSTTSATDVGKLQLPDGTPLVDMIPRIGQGGAPLAARPKQATGADTPQQAASPAPTATRKSSPSATTKAAEQAPKKGKHAKPATADTNAVTNTAPIPVIVDASSATPAPTLSSPALIGSALVAALAVLAVAKTRQLRVRPARAAALVTPAPAPTGHRRRRKPRTETAPVLARAAAQTLTAPDLTTPVELITPVELTIPAELTAANDFGFAAPAQIAASALGSEPRLDVTDPRLVTGVSRSILDRLKPLEPIAELLERASAPIPEATTQFDAFTPVPGATPRFDAFTPSARHDSTPHQPRPGIAPQHLGSHTMPQHSGSRTPYRRATEPWPIAEQIQNPQTSGYYGRRHRTGHPVDETAPFAPDSPLRGRRHRSTGRPLGSALGTETFAQDAPSRGRRHRLTSAVAPQAEFFDTAFQARHHDVHEAPASRAQAVAVAPPHPETRTTRPGSRRGRHRA
ncbi:CHAP domain-containing protein [Nonomuraea sp. NPDC050680]|uniref:CHAP domain-containing protein n=1 Tax=Nonomuraea sp. NPDC050680 TaxID=3154630 RepID=UPI0033F75A45